MNKVYFFHDGEGVGLLFAAKTFKAAKSMALGSGVTDMMDDPFINIRGHMCKNNNKKPIRTNHEGELTIVQQSKLKLLWFACGNCDSEEVVVNEQLEKTNDYMCLKCGYVAQLPYC